MRQGPRKVQSRGTKLSHREHLERRVYSFYKNNCQKRGRGFQIDLDLFKETINKNCHYCNKRPSNTVRGRGPHSHTSMRYSGIDRKDNSRGYTPDNCVPCCHECNEIKSDNLTYEEMLEVARVLRAIRAGDLTPPPQYQRGQDQVQLARLLTILKRKSATRQ